MTEKQHDFYKKSDGVHISLEQYDYLKSIERDVDKIKAAYTSEEKEISKCIIKFVLNIKNLIPESQIHEAMTKAGYTLRTETGAGDTFELGKGGMILKAKF